MTSSVQSSAQQSSAPHSSTPDDIPARRGSLRSTSVGSVLSLSSTIYNGVAGAKKPSSGLLLCGCITSAAPPEELVAVADANRKLGDVYDMEAKTIPSINSNLGIMHKCRHKVSRNILAVRTLNKPAPRQEMSEAEKVSRRRSREPERRWEDLVNEITIMKQLQHENIILVFDVFEDMRHIHIVVEHCEGMGIFDPIIAAQSFTEKQAAIIVQQIAQGLEYMHSNFIVHRDLKPDVFQYFRSTPTVENNILKITDLRSACQCKQNEVLREKVGTPYYFAPEVLSGRYNTQCDMWSLGIITYILLCGWVPFQGDSDQEVKEKIRLGSYAFAASEWKNVSKGAKELVRKTLDVNPFMRFTPSEFLRHPWVKDHAGSAGNSALATRGNDQLVERLKTFTTASPQKVRKSTLHIIAEQLKDEQVSQLRGLFGQMQEKSGKMTLRGMKRNLKQVGLKEYPLDPVRVAQESAGEDQVEFVPASVIDWERCKADVVFTAFKHMDGDGGGMIFPGDIKRVSYEGKSEAKSLIDPLSTEIIAWVDGGKPKQSELRKLIAMLRGNSYV